MWNSKSVQAADPCMRWQCDEKLGDGLNETARICADLTGTTGSANGCQPDGSFLCDAGTQLTARTNCSLASPLPWKTNLAPGDTCEMAAQCQSNTCNTTTNTCVGLGLDAVCATDIECAAGHYCSRATLKCTATVASGAACSDDIKCNFGFTCANSTCTRYGSMAVGTNFTVQDNERVNNVDDGSVFASNLCASFAAIRTEVKKEMTELPLYLCTNGEAKQFKEYGNAEVTQCKYNLDIGTGTPKETMLPSTCGYNLDTKSYCPMRRSTTEHGTLNANDAKTWADAPATCHIRTSIQYCKDIEGNDLRSLAFRSAMQTAWKASGDNYPIVANSNRCIGNTFKASRVFWRIVDSATTTVVSYFGLIASLFILTLAY